MAQKLKYHLDIGTDDSTQYITDLGSGRISIVHRDSHFYDFVVVDTEAGEVAWRKKNYETFGGVAVPIYDQNALYAPFAGNPEKPGSSSQTLCAYDPATGKQLWARGMGNGTYQFMIPPVITAEHLATVNSNTDKFTILNKSDGKVLQKVKLAHSMWDYRPWLMAWEDKFVTIGFNKRPKQKAFDIYDPALEGAYAETAGAFDMAEDDISHELAPVIIGNCIYFGTDKGYFCKCDLTTGDTAKIALLEDLEPDEDTFFRYSSEIMEHENQLIFLASLNYKTYSCVYSLSTGSCTVKLLDMDRWVIQLYEGACYHLSAKGITKVDILGDGASHETALEGWGETISGIPLGNSTSKYWLIADSKLFVMPRSTKEKIYTAGKLFCWEL